MAKRYDPKMAKLLAACCELAYVQYNRGSFKPPKGYSVAGSFEAPDTPFRSQLGRLKFRLLKFILKFFDLTRASTAVVEYVDYFFQKPFGFALRSDAGTHAIVAFRGTQDLADWVTDIDAFQVPLPPAWRGQIPSGDGIRVHLGFLLLSLQLHKQVLAALDRVDKKAPVYVTGHSLGGALSVLTSLMLKLHGFEDVRMYSFAGPRAGNREFAAAYNGLVPASYRVVNLCDVVPEVPPSRLDNWTYEHVGQAWSFLNQSGDVVGNHGINAPNNYLAAVNAGVPTDKRRKFPSK
ncbi:MAG: lipase family protein [Bacillota bacterium]